MVHEGVDIFSTSDGGLVWRLVDHTALSGSSAGSLPVAGDKTGIMFNTARSGWATLMMPVTGLNGLYKTTDGGRTWSTASLPPPSGFDPSKDYASASLPIFFGTQDGSLTANVSPPQGVSSLALYHTEDGGISWSSVSIPTPTKWSRAVFANASTWVLVGKSEMVITTDAGRQWRTVTIKQPPAGGISNCLFVQFVSGDTGFAVQGNASNQLWTTTDGGATWRSVASTLAGSTGS
jgi:hypothetical protein